MGQVYLVLGEGVKQKLSFREVCTKTECENRGIKTCPHTLFIEDSPVLEYDEFIGAFSGNHDLLNPCVSHATIGEKGGIIKYLVFFAAEHIFHEEATRLFKGGACFEPICG